jgi:glycine/D-amino acid oxidase-like deaminating enzyme
MPSRARGAPGPASERIGAFRDGPTVAKVVIIGQGGIVGASVAHHLIERGWDDIVGIDKSGIPTDIGSTGHASDFCYTTSHDFRSAGRRSTASTSSRSAAVTRASAASRSRARRRRAHGEIERKVSSGQGLRHRGELITPARSRNCCR